MLRMIPLLCAALMLTACAGRMPIPMSPSAVADATVLDEKGAIGVEIAYKAAGALIEAAVDAGALKGSAAMRAEAIDAEAHSWVKKARAAYDAGNDPDYRAAAGIAEKLIDKLRSMVGGKAVLK